jgi:Lipase (class 3)
VTVSGVNNSQPGAEDLPVNYQPNTVVLLVHGVGKTSAEELATAVTDGFNATSFAQDCTATLVRVPGGPTLHESQSGNHEPLAVMVSTSENESYAVIPLVWSDRRMRAAGFFGITCLLLLIAVVFGTVGFAVEDWLSNAHEWVMSNKLLTILIAVPVWLLLAGVFQAMNHKDSIDAATNTVMFPLRLSTNLMLGLLACIYIAKWAHWIIAAALLVLGIWLINLLLQAQRTASASWRFSLAALGISLVLLTGGTVRAIVQHGSAASPRDSSPARLYDPKPLLNPAGYGSGSGATAKPPARAVAEDNRSVVQRVYGLSVPPGSTIVMEQDDIFEEENEAWSPSLSWFLSTASLIIVPVAGVLVLLLFFAGGAYVLDFVMDLLWWIGRGPHRRKLGAAVLQAIETTEARFPGAHIVVVGHSLGSVVVMDAMRFVNRTRESTEMRIVTMGSPLNYLWRMFPRVAHSPERLQQAVLQMGVSDWLHLWRSGDPIGNALDLEAPGFRQTCVGPGGHQNYWGDSAVWHAVADFLLGPPSPAEPRESPRECLLFRTAFVTTWIVALASVVLGLRLFEVPS